MCFYDVVTEHEVVRSSSYSSYDESSSVDDMTSRPMSDRQTHMSSLEQDGPGEATPSIMSGLPGEMAPIVLFFDQQEMTKHSETLVMQDYSKIIKHDTKSEIESSDELSNGAIEAIGPDANIGHSDQHVIQRKCTMNVDESETLAVISKCRVETTPNTNFTTTVSHNSATTNQTYSHDEVRSAPTENDMLKDIIKTRDNLMLSVNLDPPGLYRKKKITADNENNRCSCNFVSADSQSKPPDKDSVSNVNFFPHKCKGASPKRYCHKRLDSERRNDIFGKVGSDHLNDGIVGLDHLNDGIVGSDHLNDGKGGMHNMDNISEIKHSSGDIETIILLKEQNDTATRRGEDSNTDIVEQVKFDENMNTYITEQLIFADDHFGLYTGSIATGVSKEFHVDSLDNCETRTSVQNQSDSVTVP